jgi:hypothetical protein
MKREERERRVYRMETRDKETKTLLIAKDYIRPLISRFGMVQNELSNLFDLPEPSAGTDSPALGWWQARTDEEQYTLRAALAAIASPVIIADVGINIRNERLIDTHALLTSLRWNDPAFLIAPENGGAQFRLEYLQKTDLFTSTLLLYLESGSPAYTMEMKFEIPVTDFAVLLALIDLRQRTRFRALLDHAVFPSAYKTGDIAATLTEGIAFPDPRWLLSFSLPTLHLRVDTLTPASTRQSLDRLAKTGLVKIDGETVTFTEPGEKFAESAGGRISCIRLDLYGVDTGGHPGRQSVILIRGEYFLWYAGISGTKTDTMVVTTIGLDQAEALLKELFTPLAVPKAVEPVCTVTPAVVQAPAPAVSPQKATGGAGKKFCPSCGKPLRPGLKFCSSCGTQVN